MWDNWAHRTLSIGVSNLRDTTWTPVSEEYTVKGERGR
jgi:hypothetical protein